MRLESPIGGGEGRGGGVVGGTRGTGEPGSLNDAIVSEDKRGRKREAV